MDDAIEAESCSWMALLFLSWH